MNVAAIRAAVPADVAGIMRSLRAAGFGAYVVGGAVRDVLAGRVPADWDLATEASPDQIRALFPAAAYENRFGTVGVRTDAETVREVTTFRADGPSSDARRPDSVTFLPRIDGDLARRDFTVNAMAFGLAPEASRRLDPVADGALVDPFDGAADLGAGMLRAVGDPGARFREDALRMLRALRFASRFALQIETATAEAIRRDASLAGRLSGERIGAEIEGMLAAPHPEIGLRALHDLGLAAAIAPSLAAEWTGDLPDRVAAVGAPGSPDAPDPLGRLAELVAPIDDDADAAALLESWRRPRASIASILAIRALDRSVAAAEAAGGGRTRAIDLRLAAASLTGDAHDAARQLRRRIAARRGSACSPSLLATCAAADADGAPARIGDLAIDGSALAATLGEAPGAWLGELLAQLLVEVAHGRTQNDAPSLLVRATELRRPLP